MTTLTSWNIKDIRTILESGQFNTEFYTTTYPETQATGLDPIIHYVLFGCYEQKNPNELFNTEIYKNLLNAVIQKEENPFAHYLRNNKNTYFFEKGLLQSYSHKILTQCYNKFENYTFFSPDYYRKINPALTFSGISPTRHALLYGIGEGRDVLCPYNIAQYFGRECKKPTTYTPNTTSIVGNLPQTVGVFYHSAGNCFIHELAELLQDYLKKAGLSAQLMTEKTPLSDKPDLCIFCAPHEFFFLEGCEHWKQEHILEQAIMFNTEQPQTLWFTRGLIYCLMSAGVIDICVQNLQAFADIGLTVFHFDPIPTIQKARLKPADKKHPFFRVLPDAAQSGSTPLKPIAERAIDVSFFGNSSANREKFFARQAAFFSDYACFLYYRKADGPLTTQGQYDILARLPRYVAENSKILLNVHRDDNHFFEWHRIVSQGMASGAVVVTEECFPHPLYKVGEHYMVESSRHIPNLIEWLLNTSDGEKESRRIQKNAFRIFANTSLRQVKNHDLLCYISSVWTTTL
ncbi:hypothetical protein [Acetobacter sp.]|uniref:hypothetical protein n=1 Tax=Acetobacter sp. TaxID=440 RepID=UPI0039E92C20